MGKHEGDRGTIHGEDAVPESRAELTPGDRIVLTIAGFDPSSGAGASADLKVFAAHRSYGMACITALTVQSTVGVANVEPVAAGSVEATLQMLAEDASFAGIKVGMLGNGDIAQVVNNFLHSCKTALVVLDPVFRSSSGRDLLDSAGVEIVREQLLRRVDWITPNIDELSVLTGQRVIGDADLPLAAEKLRDMARKLGNDHLKIVVTGGDHKPPTDYLLTADGESRWIHGERVETKATHGTGCAYSSALLCRLVAGDDPIEAVAGAKAYVTEALRAAYPVGRGNGPMNHLFMLGEEGFSPSRKSKRFC